MIFSDHAYNSHTLFNFYFRDKDYGIVAKGGMKGMFTMAEAFCLIIHKLKESANMSNDDVALLLSNVLIGNNIEQETLELLNLFKNDENSYYDKLIASRYHINPGFLFYKMT